MDIEIAEEPSHEWALEVQCSTTFRLQDQDACEARVQILQDLQQRLEEGDSDKHRSWLLTIPTTYSVQGRLASRTVFQIAGFRVPQIINKSGAELNLHGLHNRPYGWTQQIILVYTLLESRLIVELYDSDYGSSRNIAQVEHEVHLVQHTSPRKHTYSGRDDRFFFDRPICEALYDANNRVLHDSAESLFEMVRGWEFEEDATTSVVTDILIMADPANLPILQLLVGGLFAHQHDTIIHTSKHINHAIIRGAAIATFYLDYDMAPCLAGAEAGMTMNFYSYAHGYTR